MKELKDIKMIYNEDYDIHIKPYLTMSEIENIGNEMLKYENSTERQCVKNIILCETVTDMNKSTKYISDNYDILKYNGYFNIIASSIMNFNEIEEYVKEKEDLSRGFLKIVENISKKVEPIFEQMNKELKKIDTKKFMSDFVKNKASDKK